ncbi:hypothetical protein PAHAL_5G336000 [Panicum hallii]|uniref:Uncharacterized protein n=1 Tax=Panicum hallii TaxID=206008 RepID=A0A2S3HUS4_9POAL|nr:hypothetical protein PAHAL_5G336000 [Panicum hallii]
MVGGAPRGGSRPRHDAGLREQRLSVGARGSPRWAGAVEASCGGGRGWRPRRCWDPGDRCANQGGASVRRGVRRHTPNLCSRVLGSHHYAARSNLFCLLECCLIMRDVNGA